MGKGGGEENKGRIDEHDGRGGGRLDFVEGGNQGDEGNNIDLIKSCQPPPAFTSPPVPVGSFGEGGGISEGP